MTTALRPADWFPLRLHDESEHHLALAARRRTCPVERVAVFPGAPPVVLVTRYDDVAAVLADDAAFSLSVVEERYGAVLGRSMVTLAPTARRALRRVLLTRFRPEDDGAGALVREVVEQRVRGLAGLPAGQVVDLVPELAAQVPARVLARLAGLPEDEWHLVAGLAAGAARLLDEPRAALRATRQLRRRLTSELQARGASAAPPDDLLTALSTVEVDGRRLDADEVVASLLLLVWAGTETAAPAIATCTYAVLSTPGLAEAVRDDGRSALAAADEALRWEAPVQVTSRSVVQQTSVAGVRLERGEVLLAHLGSANRDETRFPDADRFDLERFAGRSSAPSLSFGSGPHRCLGAQLARVEIAESVAALLRAFPRCRLEPGSPPPTGAVVRSPRAVRVLLDPSA